MLRWLSADKQNVIDEQRLRPPKAVCLEARWDIDPPSRFMVCEWHDSWVARLRKKWHDREFDPKVPFIAHEGAPGISYGDRQWDLPAANPLRGKRVFRFTDEDTADPGRIPTSWSGKVTSCRFGDVYLSPVPKVSIHGATAEVDIRGTVRTSVDPTVRLIAMTPWGDGEEDLLLYMEEYVGTLLQETDDQDFTNWGRTQLREAFPGLLPTTPPQGLQLSLSSDRVQASPEASGDFRIALRAGGSFSTMLAIRAVSVDDKDDFVVSDVLSLVIPPFAPVSRQDNESLLKPHTGTPKPNPELQRFNKRTGGDSRRRIHPKSA